MIKYLYIDIETFSKVSLPESGVYAYSESPSFEILLIAYAINDNPVKVLDLTSRYKSAIDIGEEEFFKALLTDNSYCKVAHNAQFERVCLSRWLGMNAHTFLNPFYWRDTAVIAAYNGYPRTLEGAGAAIGLPEDKAKIKDGKRLVRLFSMPCKPTKANNMSTRNTPRQHMEDWDLFIEYNKRDVEAMREIHQQLINLPPAEWMAYVEDQRINDRGVLIDQQLMNNAIQIGNTYLGKLTEEAVKITGLDNPNSPSQLKNWLGVDGSLDKDAVQDLRKSGKLTAEQDRILAIRQEAGKSSLAKYDAMKAGMCSDGRVRGLFMFYGAQRTGRFSGRLVQLQNLPRNYMADLDDARNMVLDNDLDALEIWYKNIPDVLSQLIRTAVVAPRGASFAVADYSAIEARLLAWLADETWAIDAFHRGEDIYCATASKMFHVPVVKHGINGELRQKGKTAVLGCGYGAGVKGMINGGAIKAGMKEEELQPLIDQWREANPHIVKFWYDVEAAAKRVIKEHNTVKLKHGLEFSYSFGALSIRLPSGRSLMYQNATLGTNRFGSESITFDGVNSTTKAWGKQETYSGKLVENITQAVARDCLVETLLRAAMAGLKTVMHVHDELIVETEKPEEDLKTLLEIMKTPIPWAYGLELKGEGFITQYYMKD